MLIEARDMRIVIEYDSVRWRERAPAADADEYRELLWQVDEAVRKHAHAALRAAWECACACGRAPDADVDVTGWRVVRLPDAAAVADLKPGDTVDWWCVPRGGYGFGHFVPATVVRVGRARVTIDVPLRGRTVRRSVAPSNLRRRLP